MLALATRNDMTANNAVYTRREYRCYLKLCGNFHRDWISRHKPELVVLMGTPNIHTYRHFLFNRAHPIHPMLEAAWGDYRAPWECVYQDRKELVRTGPEQPDVLWTFHPSFRHSNPQFRTLKAAKEKKRRLREEVWHTVVTHLRVDAKIDSVFITWVRWCSSTWA